MTKRQQVTLRICAAGLVTTGAELSKTTRNSLRVPTDIRPKPMRKLITKEALISSYLQFSEDSGFISLLCI